MSAMFADARLAYHAALLKDVLCVSAAGVASNADSSNANSKRVALGITQRLKSEVAAERLAGQTSGWKFEDACASFLNQTFRELNHLRPGKWEIRRVGSRDRLEIARHEQYAHLVALYNATKRDPELAAAIGSDYTITPDIVITRETESDEVINAPQLLVDQSVATRSSLRQANGGKPLLHASISCKWTIRSDRAQNSRSEALNLIRNRKGRLPHIAVITAEPLPSRIASIALGTGDIDCVYHFALYELQDTLQALGLDDALDLLTIMVGGARLKDISDLPLDLAV